MRDFCDITIILDRSGSMNSIRDATIEGINTFIRQQKAVLGDGCWSLVLFDDATTAFNREECFPTTIISQCPEQAMKTLTLDDFVPRGNTALIDAVCMTINATGLRLGSLPEEMRPNKVLFVVMTDGLENASTLYDREKMRTMIEHQTAKYNWQFVFLGANQDAVAEGKSYGVRGQSCNTYQPTRSGVMRAMHLASVGTANYRAGTTATADIQDDAAK